MTRKKVAKEDKETSVAIWEATFLRAFEQTGQWALSAKLAEVSSTAVRRKYTNDDNFRQQCDDAREIGIDRMEVEAKRRALLSSDTLLIFLLKGARPHIYRDNYNVAVHSSSRPTDFVIDLTTDDTPPVTDITPKNILGE
jgi:hypothetical protein